MSLSVHESLLNPKVGTLATLDLFLVLIEVLDCKREELVQVVGLQLFGVFLLFLG